MELACNPAIGSKEYFHAAPLPTGKPTVVEDRGIPGITVMPDVIWSAEKTSNVRLSHADLNPLEFVHGNGVTEEEILPDGRASEQERQEGDANFGHGLCAGEKVRFPSID